MNSLLLRSRPLNKNREAHRQGEVRGIAGHVAGGCCRSGRPLSGGNYPALELQSAGPDRFEGRVHHAVAQKIFDDTFQYDLKFGAPRQGCAPGGWSCRVQPRSPGVSSASAARALSTGTPPSGRE